MTVDEQVVRLYVAMDQLLIVAALSPASRLLRPFDGLGDRHAVTDVTFDCSI